MYFSFYNESYDQEISYEGDSRKKHVDIREDLNISKTIGSLDKEVEEVQDLKDDIVTIDVVNEPNSESDPLADIIKKLEAYITS
jgi:hypothetical protein